MLLEHLLSPERVERLRRWGVAVFDVDDTLLARRSSPGGRDQNFSDSPAAQKLPDLLAAGVRVCLITGHGFRQVLERLALPMALAVKRKFPDRWEAHLVNLSLYANRGATRGGWNGHDFSEDEEYSAVHRIDPRDAVELTRVLEELGERAMADFSAEEEAWRAGFPGFAFGDLPPAVVTRESAVLSLRPIPSERNAVDPQRLSPRRRLLRLGALRLADLELDDRYEITEAGTSTLEIAQKNISKVVACDDAFQRVARERGIAAGEVEAASLVVGDEFGPGGNDRGLSEAFPSALCISVASSGEGELPPNVHPLDGLGVPSGVAGADALCGRLCKVLVELT